MKYTKIKDLIANINILKEVGAPFYKELFFLECAIEDDGIDLFLRAQIFLSLAYDFIFYEDTRAALRSAEAARTAAMEILDHDLLHPSDKKFMDRLLVKASIFPIELESDSRVALCALNEYLVSKEGTVLKAIKNCSKEILAFCLNKAGAAKADASCSFLLLALDFIRSPDDVSAYISVILKNHISLSTECLEKIALLSERRTSILHEYLLLIKYFFSDSIYPPYELIRSTVEAVHLLFLWLFKENAFSKAHATASALKRTGRSDCKELLEAVLYIIMPDQRYKVTYRLDESCCEHASIKYIKSFVEEMVLFYFELEGYNKIISLYDKFHLVVEPGTPLFAAVARSYIRIGKAENVPKIIEDPSLLPQDVYDEYLVATNSRKRVLEIIEKNSTILRATTILKHIENSGNFSFLIQALRASVFRFGSMSSTLAMLVVYYAWECLDKATLVDRATETEYTPECILDIILRINMDESPKNHRIRIIKIAMACLQHVTKPKPRREIISGAIRFLFRNMCLYVLENPCKGDVDMFSDLIVRYMDYATEVTDHNINEYYSSIISHEAGLDPECYWKVIIMFYGIFTHRRLAGAESIINKIGREPQQSSGRSNAILACLCIHYDHKLFEIAERLKLLTEKTVLQIFESAFRNGDINEVWKDFKGTKYLEKAKIIRFLRQHLSDNEVL